MFAPPVTTSHFSLPPSSSSKAYAFTATSTVSAACSNASRAHPPLYPPMMTLRIRTKRPLSSLTAALPPKKRPASSSTVAPATLFTLLVQPSTAPTVRAVKRIAPQLLSSPASPSSSASPPSQPFGGQGQMPPFTGAAKLQVWMKQLFAAVDPHALPDPLAGVAALPVLRPLALPSVPPPNLPVLTIAGQQFSANAVPDAADTKPYLINYIVALMHDASGIEWALVEWDEGDSTWQTSASLQRDMQPEVYEQLSAMAARLGDDEEELRRKEEAQTIYMRSHPNATARPAVPRRRSPRLTQCPLSAAAAARPAIVTVTPSPPPSPAPSFTVLRCSSCAQLSPGHPAPTFVCYHCAGDASAPCLRVRLHGLPRAARVTVAVHGDNDFAAFVCASTLLDGRAQLSPASADIVVCSYHEEERSVQQHIAVVRSAMGVPAPRVVLVLSCWRNPAVQTDALRQLALQHSSTVFVTFTQPNLVPIDCFQAAITHLQNIIIFPHALPAVAAAQPFVFLAQLCAAREDCVVFADCGGPAHKPELCGPLRPLACSCLTLKRQECRGCGAQCKQKDKWWHGPGQKEVKRLRCRTAQCASRVDLIVVP